MIVISNPFVFPVLVIVWSMDAWLWLTALMMIMQRLLPANHLVSGLKTLVNPVFERAKKIFSKCLRKEMPEFSLRLVTIFIVVMLRYILISLIVSH